MAAVFLRDGRPMAPERFANVSAALRLFGPHAVERCDGSAGLARIALDPFTPKDGGAQGVVEAGGGSLVLFDGVLHHRTEAIAALALDPGEARRCSDAVLFTRAWERWDVDAALRVEGEFAVVVWDAGRHTLTALCSPLSSPPLHFSVSPRRVIVASAPRAIFAWGDLPRRLDDAQLASNLIGDYRDTRASFYEGVQSLAPGEALTVTPAADRIRRYYDLAERAELARPPARADYVAAGRDLLRRAVGDALNAPETLAIMLSSGLDSQTLAATALDLLDDRPAAAELLAFTQCPEPGWDGRTPGGLPGDERPLARKLAERRPALDLRFAYASGIGTDGLDDRSDRVIELAELPPRSINMHRNHECRGLARAAGRRTVLTGRWGNATLSHNGHARLTSLLRAGRLSTLWREAAGLPPGRLGRFSPLLRHAVAPMLSDRLYRVVGALAYGDAGWRGYSAIHPDFARETRVDERARAHGFDPFARGAASRRRQQIDLLSYGVDDASTHLAMRTIHGVSERAPIGDRRLVEWCLGLPDEQYLSRDGSRLLIRRLMRNRLPPEVLATPRALQCADWHLRLSRGLPRVRDMLHDWRGDPAVAGRLDLDRLLRVVNDWPVETPLSRSDHPDHLMAWPGLDRALVAGRFIRWAQRNP